MSFFRPEDPAVGTGASLLRDRGFRRFWLGQAASVLGDRLLFIALPLFVFALTRSALQVGITVALMVAPTLAAPFLGSFVDRWDRRRTMLAANLFQAAVVLGILAVRTTAQLPMLWAIVFLYMLAATCFYLARKTSVPLLVAPEKLQAANGLLQVGDTFGQLAGPSLGGIVYAWRGIGAAAVLDAAGFLLAVSAIAATRLAVGDPPPATSGRSLWADLGEAVLFLRRSALLSWAVALWGMGIFGLGPLQVLLVVLVEKALRLPPVAFGYLLSVQGAGMLLGAAMTASVLRRIPLTRQVTAFFFVAAVSYLVLANGRSFGGVAVPMAFLGMAIAVAMVAETTLTQLAVPDRLRGRIAGVTTLVTSAGSMTSMAAAGWLADRFGARLLLDGGAAVILVGAFLAAAFFLPLRVPGQEG